MNAKANQTAVLARPSDCLSVGALGGGDPPKNIQGVAAAPRERFLRVTKIIDTPQRPTYLLFASSVRWP